VRRPRQPIHIVRADFSTADITRLIGRDLRLTEARKHAIDPKKPAMRTPATAQIMREGCNVEKVPPILAAAAFQAAFSTLPAVRLFSRVPVLPANPGYSAKVIRQADRNHHSIGAE
jgi:hypothetical protein